MTDHAPLPVKGYTSQSEANTALANEGKELEERVLRYVEKVAEQAKLVWAGTDGHLPDERGRYAALGKTNIQQGFMWTIRAIFNPQRIKLPEDV